MLQMEHFLEWARPDTLLSPFSHLASVAVLVLPISCVVVWIGTHSAEDSGETDLRDTFDDGLLKHPTVAHIDFNPITQANTVIALKRIQQSSSTPHPYIDRPTVW